MGRRSDGESMVLRHGASLGRLAPRALVRYHLPNIEASDHAHAQTFIQSVLFADIFLTKTAWYTTNRCIIRQLYLPSSADSRFIFSAVGITLNRGNTLCFVAAYTRRWLGRTADGCGQQSDMELRTAASSLCSLASDKPIFHRQHSHSLATSHAHLWRRVKQSTAMQSAPSARYV
jgi:hypothetical protein